MRSRIAGFSTLALTLGTLALPALACAKDLNDTLQIISNLLNGVIGLFVTLALVVFFWGLIKYLWSMSPDDAHEGLKIMFWGLIAIFVMVSIWGIIRLVQSTFSVENTTAIVPQGVQYNASGGAGGGCSNGIREVPGPNNVGVKYVPC